MDSEKEGPRRARAGRAEKTLPLPLSHNVCAKEVGAGFQCWQPGGRVWFVYLERGPL